MSILNHNGEFLWLFGDGFLRLVCFCGSIYAFQITCEVKLALGAQFSPKLKSGNDHVQPYRTKMAAFLCVSVHGFLRLFLASLFRQILTYRPNVIFRLGFLRSRRCESTFWPCSASLAARGSTRWRRAPRGRRTPAATRPARSTPPTTTWASQAERRDNASSSYPSPR